MKKRIFTLIAFAALFLTGFAQQAGDLVYTADGRYKINTGENLISNGNFAEGYADWTTDSGTPLEASVFSIQHGGPDGNDYLMALYKEDGPGTPTTLMRKVPVIAGQSYYISYYVKADQTVTTTITPTEKKNYQNIFYNADGSLTPEVAIAKVQDFGEEWRKLEYSYTAASDGYVVLHIFGSYTGTCFANFTMMNVTPMADDREVNKLIDRLQGYIDNPLFPNENEMLENIIAMLGDMMDTADAIEMDEVMTSIEGDALQAFLDANSVDITYYLESGNFDDLAPTSANQVKAGGWTIDDRGRQENATYKTRWAVKSAAETGAPFNGNYLQDDFPFKYILREATVSQTLENMPAAQYMLQTKARAWVWKAKDVVNEDSVVRGLQAFVGDQMTDCYPIHHTKATVYDAYGQLSEPGTLKIGFHLADSVACHVDLDVESFRIIGWTQDQVDEYFMGREFAEAKQELLDAIGQARQLLTDDHYFYARQLLTDSIARSQSVYDGSHNIDSISNQTKRMNRAISYFKQQNAEFTPFVEDIEKAEQLLADESYKNGKAELTAVKDEARAFIQTLDEAVRDSAAIADRDKKLNEAINAFMLANSTADEAYLFYQWAQDPNASFAPAYAEEPTETNATLYTLTAAFAGNDLKGRFAFLNTGLAVQLSADYGLTVNLPGKNQTVMSIDRLNEGDQVVVDWAFANASHGLYVTSANTSYQKADGTTVTLTKSGKDSSNQLPRDDNQDGLNGYQRTTFTMTAPGALEFYLGSSNSTLRISYVGITYADVSGISDATRLTNSEKVNSTVYDLQGRRVQQGTMKRGLYVVNGKKFFVK